MIAKTCTCSLLGVDAILVEVEVDVSPGLPFFVTGGLADSIVRESKDRVKTALQNSGYPFPMDRITVNPAPASLRKEGAGFDLPIAVGILAATGLVNPAEADKVLLEGEPALDGRVKPVSGGLPMAIQARESGYARMIVPAECASQAAVVDEIAVHPVRHVSEVVEFLNGRTEIAPLRVDRNEIWKEHPADELDFEDVKGQEHARAGHRGRGCGRAQCVHVIRYFDIAGPRVCTGTRG